MDDQTLKLLKYLAIAIAVAAVISVFKGNIILAIVLGVVAAGVGPGGMTFYKKRKGTST